MKLYIIIALLFFVIQNQNGYAQSIIKSNEYFNAPITYIDSIKGEYFHLVTSITPNNDGKNDSLRWFYKGIKTKSLIVRVYNSKHQIIDSIIYPKQSWGSDQVKTRCMYVTVKTEMESGYTINKTTVIELLQYTSSGCLKTKNKNHYFEDQLSYEKGFIYQTTENICK